LVAAVGAATPVNHFRLVDLVAPVVRRLQAGGGADSAVDVGDPPAVAADQVVVVIVDAILVAGGGAGRLDAADQARIR
jgi:hypothetical protein